MLDEQRTRVAVTIGGTRTGRFGPTVAEWVAEGGTPGAEAAPTSQLDQLRWWAHALRNHRAQQPYQA